MLNVGDVNGEGHEDVATANSNTSASSCALMVDMNNDGTLDLALIDEIADEVQLMHNPPAPVVVITPTPTPTATATPPPPIFRVYLPVIWKEG